MSDSFGVDMDKIESVIAMARARQAEVVEGETPKIKQKISLEERAIRKQQINLERELRKQLKTEKSQKKTVHMSKIDKAAARLPQLNSTAEITFSEIISNFSAPQISALALHLQHHNRVKSTELALQTQVSPGMSVRITGGPSRFIGSVGTVVESRRIRCFVEVPGISKPVYCFTSDVIPLEKSLSTGTSG